MARLIGGALLPPLLGVLFFYFLIIITHGDQARDLPLPGLDELISLIGLSYMFVGIPSIISSIVMEYAVNPKVRRDWLAIAIGGLLGMISAITVFLSVPTGLPIGIGLLTGLIASYWLRMNYTRNIGRFRFSSM